METPFCRVTKEVDMQPHGSMSPLENNLTAENCSILICIPKPPMDLSRLEKA